MYHMTAVHYVGFAVEVFSQFSNTRNERIELGGVHRTATVHPYDEKVEPLKLPLRCENLVASSLQVYEPTVDSIPVVCGFAACFT